MTPCSLRLVTAALLLAALGACGPKNLHDTFGLRYNAVMNTQLADRAARDPAAMRGEELSRIIKAYYETLAPEEGGGGGGGAAVVPRVGSGMPQGPTLRAR